MWIGNTELREHNFTWIELLFFSGVLNATHGRTVALGFVQINPNLVQIQDA
jgi:hypothetical protein